LNFSTLQAGRAIAAIMVVVFHAHAFFLTTKLYPGVVVSPLFNMGYSGVEFFFVLSGFVMALVHTKDLGCPERAGNFLRMRVTRIYPFYWVVLGGLLLAYMLLPGLGPADARSVPKIAASALLLRLPDDFIIVAAWTLAHEMLFYLVFCISILNRRFGMALFALWVAAILVNIVVLHLPYPGTYLLSPFNLLFLFGMGSAALFPRLGGSEALVCALGGIGAFFLVGVLDVYGLWQAGEALRTLAYGVAAALAISGLAQLESQGRVRSPSFLAFLGMHPIRSILCTDPFWASWPPRCGPVACKSTCRPAQPWP